MGHTKRRANPQLKSRTTRSSRGRLLSLSDPAQNSQLLDSQLRQLGLYAAATIGDGNCLFRALSDQRYGTDSRHAQLRQDICDWMQKHKARYEPFVEDDRGIDAHLRCMRENATYGGHIELSAFAHMAKKNVKVVQPGLVYVIEWQAFHSPTSPEAATVSPVFPDKENHHQEGDDDDSTIYVAYHDWEHFSSIRNLKGPHVGLPRVKERPPPTGADSGPSSPITEQYMPSKERKKVEKERERERKERKRERARNKAKPGDTPTMKGKQKAESIDSESEFDDDGAEVVLDDHEVEREISPEKLKIKLKLTLNGANNPSSTNISESENNTTNTNAGEINTNLSANNSQQSLVQKTGLKLRLPPSRSLSVTPSVMSTVSTPPMSQASTISVASSSSASSTATLPIIPIPNTNTTTTPSFSSATPEQPFNDELKAADYASTYAELPHAHPPTHTSAPHLTSESDVLLYPHHNTSSTSSLAAYPSSSSTTSSPPSSYNPNAPQRTNRSPKRTFDESELEDGNGGGDFVRGKKKNCERPQAKSRLRGPEEFEATSLTAGHHLSSQYGDRTKGADVNMGDRDRDPDREGEEREEWEVVETLVEPSQTTHSVLDDGGGTGPQKPPATKTQRLNEEEYESDLSTTSSLSSLDSSPSPPPPSSRPVVTVDTTEVTGVGTSGSGNSIFPPPPSQDQGQEENPTSPMLVSPSKPTHSHSHSLSSSSQLSGSDQQLTRRQKQIKRELESGLNGIAYANTTAPFVGSGGIATASGTEARVLTRRQRKMLGLPKPRRTGGPYDRIIGGEGASGGGKGGKKGRAGQEDQEQEWKKNGTGRVDVRGFRELKI